MRKSANKTFTKTTAWNTKDLAEGATLEGRYEGQETFEGNFGETTKYVIVAGEEAYGVYGTASLNRQFKNIPEGSYVWITYNGLTTSKNGRQVKDFSVDFDDEA
jgi:hypothetical protein